MKIQCIELKNFRNYNNLTLFLNEGTNVLVGANAQGKTNILEGIFLCAIGRSPRTNKEKELIKWNCEFAKITLELTKISGRKKIEFYIFQNATKVIKVNSFVIKKIGELMGEFNAVYFSPDELKLVKDSPNERRRFMDISISQFDKNYFYNLSKYNKILLQRNKLLKSTTNKKNISDTIGIWDEELATTGAYIITERIKFLNTISKYVETIHTYLTDNKEKISLSYVGFSGEPNQIKEQIIFNLNANLEKDMENGFTSYGPHRDDIKISINNIDVRIFGSQGQKRTVALSLKLAELEVFKETIGEYPVLLLDDVLSELDIDRQKKLLSWVKKYQTIITGTEFNFDIANKKFIIENGTIKN